MRLLLVVDVFPPTRTSAAVQMRDLAAALGRMGHRCTVVTPDHRGGQQVELQKDALFSVLRIRSAPLKRINLMRRAVNEILLSARMWAGYRRSSIAKEPVDGIAFYSPSIFFGRFVAKLKAHHGCKAYLILRDVFPDWAADLGVMSRGPHYWVFKGFARYQYSVADRIGIEAPSNRRYFDARDARVEIMPNWIELRSESVQDVEMPLPLAGKKVLVYAGNMGVAQDMDNLLRLARGLLPRKDCAVLFVGDGSERHRMEAETKRQGLANVVFHAEVDPLHLHGIARRCYLGLISLDHRLRTHNVPGKLLSYLHAGLPVIASINPGSDLRSIVEDAGAGVVLANGDDRALLEAATALLDDDQRRNRMSVAAFALCCERFSSDTAARHVLAALAGGPKGSTAS